MLQILDLRAYERERYATLIGAPCARGHADTVMTDVYRPTSPETAPVGRVRIDDRDDYDTPPPLERVHLTLPRIPTYEQKHALDTAPSLRLFDTVRIGRTGRLPGVELPSSWMTTAPSPAPPAPDGANTGSLFRPGFVDASLVSAVHGAHGEDDDDAIFQHRAADACETLRLTLGALTPKPCVGIALESDGFAHPAHHMAFPYPHPHNMTAEHERMVHAMGMVGTTKTHGVRAALVLDLRERGGDATAGGLYWFDTRCRMKKVRMSPRWVYVARRQFGAVVQHCDAEAVFKLHAGRWYVVMQLFPAESKLDLQKHASASASSASSSLPMRDAFVCKTPREVEALARTLDGIAREVCGSLDLPLDAGVTRALPNGARGAVHLRVFAKQWYAPAALERMLRGNLQRVSADPYNAYDYFHHPSEPLCSGLIDGVIWSHANPYAVPPTINVGQLFREFVSRNAELANGEMPRQQQPTKSVQAWTYTTAENRGRAYTHAETLALERDPFFLHHAPSLKWKRAWPCDVRVVTFTSHALFARIANADDDARVRDAEMARREFVIAVQNPTHGTKTRITEVGTAVARDAATAREISRLLRDPHWTPRIVYEACCSPDGRLVLLEHRADKVNPNAWVGFHHMLRMSATSNTDTQRAWETMFQRLAAATK
jgi:hypothetical protein